jgi:acetyltransferase-like isoleucine patch superfamily enzyme
MTSIFETYLSAAFQTWAASKTQKNWRGFWRLKKLGIEWQLKDVQKIGSEIELAGPVIIKNAGTIDIGNQVIMDASWHKPIYLSLASPEAKLTIENNAFINYGAEISLMKEVFIGAYSMISIDCLIYDTDWHSLDGLDHDVPAEPTRIGRGVWLGARTIVLKGVTIGDNTVVAANSLVTKDLPDHVLAGGCPAKVIRPIQRRRYDPGTQPPFERGDYVEPNA